MDVEKCAKQNKKEDDYKAFTKRTKGLCNIKLHLEAKQASSDGCFLSIKRSCLKK